MSIKTQHIKSILIKEGRIPNQISVVLTAGNEARGLHCMGCGKYLRIDIQHRILAIVQDDMSQVFKTSPIIVQCQTCGNCYHVSII